MVPEIAWKCTPGANASNPDGWGALAKATVRLGYPHLPNGLASRLAGADQAMYVIPEPDELAERAKLVIDAASWFPGQPDVLAVALGQEPDIADQLPDWLVNLVLDLGRAGLGPEAAGVGRALAQVDPDRQAFFDGARWPDDLWIQVQAGDALAALGDLDGAESHLRVAVGMAEDADDLEARYDALDRLRRLGRSRRRRDGAGRPVGQRRQPTRRLSTSQRKRRSRRKR